MSETLKPCPFCGKSPTLIEEGENIGYGLFADKYFIYCENCEKDKSLIYCSTRAQGYFTQAQITNVCAVTADRKDEVIKRWNNRPHEDELTGMQQALADDLALEMGKNAKLREALRNLKVAITYAADTHIGVVEVGDMVETINDALGEK